MAAELLTTLIGAIQGSLSILLVIFYGVLASQYGLLSNSSAKAMSHLSVKIFLPFLLITKVGEVINMDNAMNFVPVVLWSLFYTLTSMAIGHLGVRFLGLPAWVTPAVAFNNTTSLPLLLVQSFESTGILNPILRGNENTKEAINRAQSYFLVCSVIGKCLTFALGPALLEAEGLERDYDRDRDRDEDRDPRKYLPDGSSSSSSSSPFLNGNGNGNGNNYSDNHNPPAQEPDLTTVSGNRIHREREEREARQNGEVNETTSLLPDTLNNLESQLINTAHDHSHAFLHRHHAHFDDFSSRTNRALSIVGGFFNGVLGGAILGVILGLVPALHRAFFADSMHGGIFTSWVTQSLRDTGELFVTLQVILVGVNLSSSLRRLKRGETAVTNATSTNSSALTPAPRPGTMPWSAALFVFTARYIFWPLISIPLISFLARTKTGSVFVHAVTLALFTLGVCGMIGTDDVLACFVAGCTFSHDEWFKEKTEKDSLQPSVDMLLNVSIFMWFGAVTPWHEFRTNASGMTIWTLIAIAVLILLFRRLPAVWLARNYIPEIQGRRQAFFAGFFGPIGVGAVFYLHTAREYLQEVDSPEGERLSELVRLIVWFLVISSIIVHGLAIPLVEFGLNIPNSSEDAPHLFPDSIHHYLRGLFGHKDRSVADAWGDGERGGEED